MKRIRRLLHGSSRGLTLVEVVIAMALIAIIGVAFLGGLSQSIWSLHMADVRTTAESLARSEMEYLKSLGYDAALDGQPPQSIAPPGYDGYTVERSFTHLADGLQQVELTVIYHRGSERDEILTLIGYRARR